MPPKTQFRKEEIVNSAIEIIEKEGLESLSARKIAEKMGSSVAPIYTSFKTMADLELELMKKIKDILLEYTNKSYTDIPSLNIGVGYIYFAREHKKLFEIFFHKGSQFEDVFKDFYLYINNRFKELPFFKDLTNEEREKLLGKLWIMTHGMACLASVGLLKDDSDEKIISILNDAGGDLIGATILKSESEDCINEKLHKIFGEENEK